MNPQQQEGLSPHVDADLRNNEILKMKQNLFMRSAAGTLRQFSSNEEQSDENIDAHSSSPETSTTTTTTLTAIPGYKYHHRRSSSSFKDSIGEPLPLLVSKNGGRSHPTSNMTRETYQNDGQENNKNNSSHQNYFPQKSHYIHPSLLLSTEKEQQEQQQQQNNNNSRDHYRFATQQEFENDIRNDSYYNEQEGSPRRDLDERSTSIRIDRSSPENGSSNNNNNSKNNNSGFFPSRVQFSDRSTRRVNEFDDDDIVIRSASTKRDDGDEEEENDNNSHTQSTKSTWDRVNEGLQSLEANENEENKDEEGDDVNNGASPEQSTSYSSLPNNINWKQNNSTQFSPATKFHEEHRVSNLFPQGDGADPNDESSSSSSRLRLLHQKSKAELLRAKYPGEYSHTKFYENTNNNVPHPQEFPKIQDPFETMRGISNRPLMNATAVLRSSGLASASASPRGATYGSSSASPTQNTSSPLPSALKTKTIGEHISSTKEEHQRQRERELLRQQLAKNDVDVESSAISDQYQDDDERINHQEEESVVVVDEDEERNNHQENDDKNKKIEAAVLPSVAWDRESFSSQQRKRVLDHASDENFSYLKERTQDRIEQEKRILRDEEKKRQRDLYAKELLVDSPVAVGNTNINDKIGDNEEVGPGPTRMSFIDSERSDPREVHDLIDRSERRKRKQQLFDELLNGPSEREVLNSLSNTNYHHHHHASPFPVVDENDIERITYNDDDDDDEDDDHEDTSFLYMNTSANTSLPSPIKRNNKSNSSPYHESLLSMKQHEQERRTTEAEKNELEKYLQNPPKDPHFDEVDIADENTNNNNSTERNALFSAQVNDYNDDEDENDDPERSSSNLLMMSNTGTSNSILPSFLPAASSATTAVASMLPPHHVARNLINHTNQEDNYKNNNNNESSQKKMNETPNSLKNLIDKKIVRPRQEAKADALLQRFQRQVENSPSNHENHEVNDYFVRKAKEVAQPGALKNDDDVQQKVSKKPERPDFSSDFLFTTPAKKFAGYNRERNLETNTNDNLQNASEDQPKKEQEEQEEKMERNQHQDPTTSSSSPSLFIQNADSDSNVRASDAVKLFRRPSEDDQRRNNTHDTRHPSAQQPRQQPHQQPGNANPTNNFDSLFVRNAGGDQPLPTSSERNGSASRQTNESKNKSLPSSTTVPLLSQLEESVVPDKSPTTTASSSPSRQTPPSRSTNANANTNQFLAPPTPSYCTSSIPAHQTNNEHEKSVKNDDDDADDDQANINNDGIMLAVPTNDELLPKQVQQDQQEKTTEKVSSGRKDDDENAKLDPSSPSSPVIDEEQQQQQQLNTSSSDFDQVAPEALSLTLRECRQTSILIEKLHKLRRNPSYLRPCKQKIVALWRDYIVVFDDDADPDSVPCETPIRLISTITTTSSRVPELQVTPATSPTFASHQKDQQEIIKNVSSLTTGAASGGTVSPSFPSSPSAFSSSSQHPQYGVQFMPLPITTREDPETNKKIPSAVKWPLCIGNWEVGSSNKNNGNNMKNTKDNDDDPTSTSNVSSPSSGTTTPTTVVVLSFASRSHRDQWQDSIVMMQRKSLRRQRMLQLAQKQQQQQQQNNNNSRRTMMTMGGHDDDDESVNDGNNQQQQDLLNSLPSLISATLALAAQQQQQTNPSGASSPKTSTMNNNNNNINTQNDNDANEKNGDPLMNSTATTSDSSLTPQQAAVVKNVLKLWRK